MAKKSFFSTELYATGAVIAACLFFVGYFPKDDIFQEVVVGTFFFLIVPALYSKIILKKGLKDLGVETGDWKSGIMWIAISAVMLFLIYYILFHYTSFADKYSLPARAAAEFKYFVLYEILVVGFISALYEFFFRGFVMFIFKERFGQLAIVIQAVVFLLLLAFSGSRDFSMVPLLVVSLFSGLTAYRSESLIYSFAVSLLSVVILDSVIIRLLN